MKSYLQVSTSRREFIKNTGKLAAVSALANVAIPAVHAAGSDLIQVALIGCGGRGGGAAANALSVKRGPVKLVAMADIFPDRLQKDLTKLQMQFAGQVDVPPERQFIGFDAYQKAMDCLKPGDVAIFATPPAFRWVHFTYAIQKGLNVFMEKPLTADGPTSKRMFSLAREAQAKNLKVGVGLMSRHNRAMQELAKRVHDGEIGEIILQRGYRMHGLGGYFNSLPKPAGITDLLYQMQRFHSFIWASGGCFNDFYIHLIDQLGWMKNEWPVKAQALGGRQYRSVLKESCMWIRISTHTRWNTPIPTAPSSFSTGAPSPAANRSIPVTCMAPKGRESPRRQAIAGSPQACMQART